MRFVAMLALAAVLTTTAAAHAQTSGSGGVAPATITGANVASVAFAQAMVWQQWMMLSAIDAYARDPNVKPEDIEAARRAWLTNGGAMMTVPSSGPGARWFTNGADVLSTPPAPSASAATAQAPEDAGDANADAAVDAGVDAGEDAYPEDAYLEDAMMPDGEIFDAGPQRVLATPTTGPEADAQATAVAPAQPPAGGGPTSLTPPGPTSTPTFEAPSSPRVSRVGLESRGWLVVPASAALALFVAALVIARRARAH